jgi:serine/threonine protein kinase
MSSNPDPAYEKPSVASPPPVVKACPEETDPLIGCVLDGRYQIVEFIDSGGSGNVYRGLHLTLGIDIAVKIIHKHLTQRQDSLKRLEQEALLLSRFESPYIVRLMDYGLEPAPYIIMEYFDGEPLDGWLKSKGPLKANLAIELFMQICQGLSTAHALGLVHRDLKPSNIMLRQENGRIKSRILDFGIAKLIDDQKRLTSTGEVLGSPPYMSPEQWKGCTDPRSDLYSLGCIMYEAISSKPPFEAEYGLAYVSKHMSATPQRIRVFAPQVEFPEALEDVIGKCLAKLPEKRYQSAEELLAELERVKTGRKLQIHINKERQHRQYKVMAASAIAIVGMVAVCCWQKEALLTPWSDHFNSIADSDREHSRFEAAIANYRKSLIPAHLLPLQSRSRLHALRMLSDCLRQQKKFKEAAELQKQVDRAIGSGPFPEFNSVLRRLKHRLFVKADKKRTLELAQQAVKMATALAGKHSMAYSQALDALASVMKAQGCYEPASQAQQESLRIAEDLLEPNSVYLAERLNHEGAILAGRGDMQQAEKSYERALQICTRNIALSNLEAEPLPTVQPLIVADFDDGNLTNNLNGALTIWSKELVDKTQGTRLTFAPSDARGNPDGKSLQVDYDVDSPVQAFNGFSMKLESTDFSSYDTFNLFVKGDASAGFDRRLKIELKDTSGNASSCFVSGITDKWQRFSIPFDKFMMLSDWSHMYEFVVIFEDVITAPRTGRIYLDQISATYENQFESKAGVLTQMVGAYNGLSALAMQKQDRQAALAYFEKAYQLCRNEGKIDSLPVILNMASLYQKDRNRQEGIEYWQKALDSHLEGSCSRSPETETVLSALADICIQLKDYKQAEAYLETGYIARVQAPEQDAPLIPLLEKWIQAARAQGKAGEAVALERVLQQKVDRKSAKSP